jgi:pyruvate/2-oxoglutarate dehydrogenase complex dihydrolipoamide acyltransferase (E2) component
MKMSFFAVLLILYILYQLLPSTIFIILVSVGFAGFWYFASSGMTLRQKLAISTWSAPDNGQIFVQLEIHAEKLKNYIEEIRKKNDKKVTVTHLVGRALGIGLKNSSLNARLAFGRLLKNKDVDISFLVQLDDGKNLAPTLVRSVDHKSVQELYDELNESVGKLRKNQDQEFKKNMDLVKMLPTFLLRPISRLLAILTGDLAIGIPALGIKQTPFGCCIVTSIGMLGVDSAFVPFTPFARTPILVVIGAIKDQPVVRNGQIVIAPILKITFTLDHRFIDGVEAARLGKHFQEALENPELLDKKTQ